MSEGRQPWVRVLPEETRRVETGPLKFGNDWPGVFIRGDDAHSMAKKLRLLAQCLEMLAEQIDVSWNAHE